MTTTLKLYTLPLNLLDKNFKMDSWSTYLATLTPLTKSDFQYQRFTLESKIKVNLSQDYQNQLVSKYNYVSITAKISNVDYTYYYFVKKFTQISQATIELELYMDVLNTFTYTLSPKSIITREHKDRIDYSSKVLELISSEEDWSTFINQLEMGQVASAPETGFFMFSYQSLWSYCLANYGAGNRVVEIDGTDTEALILYNDYKYVYSCDKIVLNCANANFVTIEIWYNGILQASYQSGGEVSIGIKINEDESWPLDNLTWGTTPETIIDFYNFVLAIYKVYLESFKYRRIIDYYQEGLATTLFKKKEETLFDEDEGNQWYIMYVSENAVTNSNNTIIVNPVRIQFIKDSGYKLTTSSSSLKTIYATDSRIPKWINSEENIGFVYYSGYSGKPTGTGQKYVIINGTTYDFYNYEIVRITRSKNNDVSFISAKIVKNDQTVTTINTPFSFFQVYGINEVRVYGLWDNEVWINLESAAGSASGTAKPWAEIDLSEPRLIKAFAFPYSPIKYLVNKNTFDHLEESLTYNGSDNLIEIQNPQQTTFSYQKEFKYKSPLSEVVLDVNAGYTQARNIKYESKLLHSDYYQPKFVYDSFSYMFALENIDVNQYLNNFPDLDKFIVTYSVSKNILSKFMFQFDQCYFKRSTQDYDNILIIDRNNEKALYNNSYINYIKSGGFSYDTKKANSQNAVNGITTALSIVGSIASFAGAAATQNPMLGVAGVGLATSAIAGITKSIHTAQEQDRAIAQKILQTQMQGTSVQGTEDIDLLTQFSGNKPKLVYYGLSDLMQKAMWDLFHYCGYATHEQKTPSTNTRIYFNFVQGDVIIKDFHFNDDIYEELHNCYLKGVTYMHYVNSSYDWEQQYENFETSLF